jgi:hypothetical protein
MAANLTPEPTQQDSEMDLEEVSMDTALLDELARPRKKRSGGPSVQPQHLDHSLDLSLHAAREHALKVVAIVDIATLNPRWVVELEANRH